MGKGVLVWLFVFSILLSIGFTSAQNYHNAYEIYVNISDEIYNLQEMFDMHLFYEDSYNDPVNYEYIDLQYEFASDILITIDPNGEVNFLEILNFGNSIEGGYFDYVSFVEKHTGNEIIFRDGRTFQEVISNGEVCHPDVGEDCGETECRSSGIVLCNGTCQGYVNVEDYTRCSAGVCFDGFCGDPLLVNEVHTRSDCAGTKTNFLIWSMPGNFVVDEEGAPFCVFFGSSCPTGWNQYKGWSATWSHTCESCNDCTTGYHALSNNALIETCRYKGGSRVILPWDSYCTGSSKTCYATKMMNGCY